ncbi:hypothetical protein HAZT_HAZT001907 [Hyalella azteca]|uniref:26S proteasome non-ATPase regulatory subunit 1/RPN2 N-terminal domain-containing protein n=1 Tax=Hyalella azteca TaxID=294128 RepID=A0A6A0H5J2_HYAAZ|nr:hypothetical protein HAZT_HAZT001907 [Hyalella azteca]
MLDEPEAELQVFALERLNEIIDVFWPEIADSVQKIEALQENETFAKRELAALVVSKVYFHLGSYLDSLNFALRSGSLLSKDPNTLYIDTIKGSQHYINTIKSIIATQDPNTLYINTIKGIIAAQDPNTLYINTIKGIIAAQDPNTFYIDSKKGIDNFSLYHAFCKFSASSSQLVSDPLVNIAVNAIDHYVGLRRDAEKMDPRLEALLNGLFEHSLQEHQYRHALGIAIETQRMDWFSQAIAASDDRVGSMQYSYRMAMQYVEQKLFRDTVLEELVRLYQKDTHRPDYVNMCQCLIHLDRPSHIATILDSLIKDDSLKTAAMRNTGLAVPNTQRALRYCPCTISDQGYAAPGT